jgi:hypothetical protein
MPVGMIANEEIVAVRVTAFDKKPGLGEELSVTLGIAGITVRVTLAVEVV